MAKWDYSDELEFDIESVTNREQSVESRTIETEAMQDPDMRISDPLTIVTTDSPGREIGASPDEAGRALHKEWSSLAFWHFLLTILRLTLGVIYQLYMLAY